MSEASQDFTVRLLAWHARHGRSSFPWQRDCTPYRVWVSEIMLQQTRTTTVEAYFVRFTEAFPDVQALARAPLDEVLHRWSGLGYYARARNMHRAAQTVVERHAGRMPEELEELMALPGIGRSTAGAILALSRGKRHAILDGNAKRVLARHAGVEGRADDSAVLKRLWALAEERTPEREAAAYTQAIMDLGATVCLPRTPACERCPVLDGCSAHRQGRVAEIPAPRARKARPQRYTRMLLAQDDDGRVLMQRRPAQGIWGGLWTPPELPEGDDISVACRRLGLRPQGTARELAPIDHAFSHFDLRILPLLQPVQTGAVMDDGDRVWYNPGAPSKLGLAAPVALLLERVSDGAGKTR